MPAFPEQRKIYTINFHRIASLITITLMRNINHLRPSLVFIFLNPDLLDPTLHSPSSSIKPPLLLIEEGM